LGRVEGDGDDISREETQEAQKGDGFLIFVFFVSFCGRWIWTEGMEGNEVEMLMEQAGSLFAESGSAFG
jgi:hypothetical protein